MPAPDDFLHFAAGHAHELVRVGHAATGELAVGERLAEDALVEVFRSWPLLPADDRLPAARRALATAARQGRRLAAAPRFSGGLELRDFRAVDNEEVPPSGDLDNGAVLWEALDNLSAPQRLTVALLYAGDLTVDEAARVLRRPVAAVRRTQCRALNELRLAADLEPAVVTERGVRLGARTISSGGSERHCTRTSTYLSTSLRCYTGWRTAPPMPVSGLIVVSRSRVRPECWSSVLCALWSGACSAVLRLSAQTR